MSGDDLVQRLRAASRDERLSTGLLYREAADRIDELEATLKRQKVSYEREREIDEERIEALEHERSNDLNVMQMALEALTESRDTVWNEYTADWRHGMPTRKAQLDGMKEMCEAHDAAIAALRERLK